MTRSARNRAAGKTVRCLRRPGPFSMGERLAGEWEQLIRRNSWPVENLAFVDWLT